ncbi:MAG: hypothetical protein NTV21_14990 [Planctomycetota bacterium]|nr:hypothetical protein [Planctomycetota bacterium]
MKLAILVMSDPARGGDEALGRVFNALALAADGKRAGSEVAVVFAGAGTRWPGELTKLGHPVKALYDSVRDVVQGASCGCSDVFGARASVEACGVPLLTDNKLDGTSGLAGIHALVARGFTPIVF